MCCCRILLNSALFVLVDGGCEGSNNCNKKCACLFLPSLGEILNGASRLFFFISY